jgi:hypothetical protein
MDSLMIDHTLDIILVIAVLSFWILFPVGIFWSMSHVDKNTDQIIRLDQLRHESMSEEKVVPLPETKVATAPPEKRAA